MNTCSASSSPKSRLISRFLALIVVVSIGAEWRGSGQEPSADDSRFASCGESRIYLDRSDRVCMLSGAVRYSPPTNPSSAALAPADRELRSAIRVPISAEVESLVLYGDDELTQPLRVAGQLVTFRPDANVSSEASLKVEQAKAGFRWVGFSAALPAGAALVEPLRFRWAYVLRSYPELASLGEHTCAVYWNGDGPGSYIAQFCRVRSDAHSSHSAHLGGAWTSSVLVIGCLAGVAFLSARWRRRRTAVAQTA